MAGMGSLGGSARLRPGDLRRTGGSGCGIRLLEVRDARTSSDVFEVELLDREVESPAAPAVSRTVESGLIADEDREALARFMGSSR